MTAHDIREVLAGAAWLCASFLGTAALAQHEPPPVVMKPPAAAEAAATAVAPVTVQATRPEELKKQTYGFVQTFAATTDGLDQVARWAQPICVRVVGLPMDAEAEVKGRVEEVAKALMVGVKKAGCKPNIQIAFTNSPKAVIDQVARDDEMLLGYRHTRDRDKLTTITRPVQAWYVTGTGGEGGDTTGMAFMTFKCTGVCVQPPVGTYGRQPNGFQYDDEDNYRGRTGCADSRSFTACLTSEFQHVLVIVDMNKVKDLSAGVLADYVTMLAMSQPKSLDGCNVLPSVVDLFSKTCSNLGMDGLTRADVAYLTALYKTNLEAKKAGQQSDIARRMADFLLMANAEDRATVWGAPQKTSAGK
jgi:hypothetical protein